MESRSSKQLEELRREDNIKRHIAFLQAQLKNPNISASTFEPPSPKRKSPDSGLLVPTTPSPKKRNISSEYGSAKTLRSPSRRGNQRTLPSLPGSSEGPAVTSSTHLYPPKAAPSTVIQKLSTMAKQSEELEAEEIVSRSSGFKEAPAAWSNEKDSGYGLKRDDRLALVEELEVGPVDHKAPFDDPHFEKLEPNSGIRLSQRAIPHDEFQDYLRGRYYLSPSRLYSVIRLLPNKSGYDVPVSGDWVTISVVAERGPVKFTRAPVDATKDGDITAGDDGTPSTSEKSKSAYNGKGKTRPRDQKPHGKRYVNLKLIDFGARSGGSFATGGKSVIRGDAFLTLLLFESEGFEVVEMVDGEKQKIWKGGSKGAFETMAKLKEGSVVALLNPRVLKPFQKSNEDPHPVNNVLALTPESADSVAVIGHAKDLGMCTVTKRDGKICGGWCDKRVSDVCEWHVQNAVERRRAGRSEFSIGTSGMSTNSGPKRKRDEYDPRRQWGLKPDLDSGSGAVYVVSGHVVSGSSAKDMYVTESIGREGQAKAARKLAAKDTDKMLQEILKRDKDGMKALVKAREFGLKAKKVNDKKTRGKGKRAEEEEGDAAAAATELPKVTNAFSAKMIKDLGFDPTNKNGSRKVEDVDVQKKLQALSSLRSTKKDADFEAALSSRPGRRRSQLSVPSKPKPPVEEKMIDLDGSESEVD